MKKDPLLKVIDFVHLGTGFKDSLVNFSRPNRNWDRRCSLGSGAE